MVNNNFSSVRLKNIEETERAKRKYMDQQQQEEERRVIYLGYYYCYYKEQVNK